MQSLMIVPGELVYGERTMIRFLTFAALTFACAALPVRAQTQTQNRERQSGLGTQITRQATTERAQSAVPDPLFAAAAGSAGLAEVNLSEIGLQHTAIRSSSSSARRWSRNTPG